MKIKKTVPGIVDLWYPRYIISLDRFRDQQEGVHHINAIDLFLGKVRI